HIIEIGRQLAQHLLDTFIGEGILVACLRRRQDIQAIDALVANQRLFERCLAVDDVDKIEDDTALAAHDKVKIAQPDVEIHHRRLVAALRQAGGKGRGGSGLADAALAGRQHDYMCHACYSCKSINRLSWSRLTWTQAPRTFSEI